MKFSSVIKPQLTQWSAEDGLYKDSGIVHSEASVNINLSEEEIDDIQAVANIAYEMNRRATSFYGAGVAIGNLIRTRDEYNAKVIPPLLAA